ncbi:hypothetical protein CHS0354_028173, partial [Potamilus streckersoni]
RHLPPPPHGLKYLSGTVMEKMREVSHVHILRNACIYPGMGSVTFSIRFTLRLVFASSEPVYMELTTNSQPFHMSNQV